MFHYKDTNRVTDRDRELIKQTFKRYSTCSNKQLVNKTDFKVSWLYLFGYKPSKYEVEQIFQKFNKDYYTNGLTFSEFEECTVLHLKRLDIMEECRNAFLTYDFSCKGFLTIDDFQKAFQIACPKISKKLVNDVFRELDRDCDQRVSYKDFELAIQYYDDTYDYQAK